MSATTPSTVVLVPRSDPQQTHRTMLSLHTASSFTHTSTLLTFTNEMDHRREWKCGNLLQQVHDYIAYIGHGGGGGCEPKTDTAITFLLTTHARNFQRLPTTRKRRRRRLNVSLNP